MILIYVKFILLILFNSLLFSKTHGESLKKISVIVPEMFDVFTFSMQPLFHLEKENLHIFVELEYLYHKIILGNVE